ncbi:hypothetical protein F4679DRAFT_544824 [Xylaria curta]|nr:hypothetical protein F4679DRAFT_544824 [Xylaria curta]
MEDIYSTITDLTHDLEGSGSSESSFQTHIQNSCQMLGIFLSDPWFSSLWTLQEAFLRPDALFLSKEGLKVSRLSAGGSSVEFTFDDLILLERSMRKTRKCIPHSAVQSWKAILDMMHTTGISPIGSLNFIAAYVAAKDRTATRGEDRVYGIQQLFNFRLGSTAPGSAGTYWTISQLEDLLAEKLLKRHPVSSQLHVFTEPARFGTAWRLNESSACPVVNDLAVSPESGSPGLKSSCKFSTRQVLGITWGHFEGWLMNFETFVRRCYEAERSSTIRAVLAAMPANVRHSFSFKIYLDATAETLSFSDLDLGRTRDDLNDTEYGISGLDQLRARPEKALKQEQLAQRLVSLFGSSGLVNLELGLLNDGRGRNTTWSSYGLILLPKEQNGFKYFHRLGWCYWEDYGGKTRRQRYPGDWGYCSGLFG